MERLLQNHDPRQQTAKARTDSQLSFVQKNDSLSKWIACDYNCRLSLLWWLKSRGRCYIYIYILDVLDYSLFVKPWHRQRLLPSMMDYHRIILLKTTCLHRTINSRVEHCTTVHRWWITQWKRTWQPTKTNRSRKSSPISFRSTQQSI